MSSGTDSLEGCSATDSVRCCSTKKSIDPRPIQKWARGPDDRSRRGLLVNAGLWLSVGLAGCTVRIVGSGWSTAHGIGQVQGDLERLADAAVGNTDLPDAELARLRMLPLPQQDDPSIELCLLRRGLAALLLGDEQGVREIQRERGLKSTSPWFRVSVEQLTMMVDWLKGDFPSALRRMRRIEQMVDGSDALTTQLLISVSGLIDNGQLSAAESAIDRLPPTLSADATALDRWNYEGERVRLLAHIAVARGRSQQATQDLGRWLERVPPSVAVNDSGQARRVAFREVVNRANLVDFLAARGRIDAANNHAVRVHELARLNGTPVIRGFAERTRLSLSMATGDYEASLKILQARTVTGIERHWPLPRRSRGLLLAAAAAGAERWDLARAELASLGTRESGWPRWQLLRATTLDAYVATRQGDDTTSALQGIAQAATTLQEREVSDLALFHHGAKCILLGANRRTAGSLGAMKAASEFRRVLHTMRRTDIAIEMTWPRNALREASEAGLLSTTVRYMAGQTGVDDLLDALFLVQENETEQSAADALLRRTGSNALAAEDLRKLQLARQAAREAILARTSVELADLSAAQRQVQGALRDLDEALATLEVRAPSIAGLLAVRPTTAAEIQARLGSGDLLLAIVPLRGETVVFAATTDGLRVEARPVPSGELAVWVSRVRRSCLMSPNQSALPAFDVAAAQQLRRSLMGGVEDLIARCTRLTIATGGLLAALPFAALPEASDTTGGLTAGWLGSRVTLTQAVSLRQWALSRGSTTTPGDDSRGLLSWADPEVGGDVRASTRGADRLIPDVDKPIRPQEWLVLRPGLAALPHARAEAAQLAGLFSPAPALVRMGKMATRTSVMQSLAGERPAPKVLHFATHALAPGEVRDLGQPAMVMAAEGGDARSQLLTLDDVMSLRVDADLVLLSACSTAAAARPGGDAMSGLVRGFLFAGAGAVMATHWPVEDENSARFVVEAMRTYMRTRVPLAEALRSSMASQARGYPSRPGSHPAHWAGWVVMGTDRAPPS